MRRGSHQSLEGGRSRCREQLLCLNGEERAREDAPGLNHRLVAGGTLSLGRERENRTQVCFGGRSAETAPQSSSVSREPSSSGAHLCLHLVCVHLCMRSYVLACRGRVESC